MSQLINTLPPDPATWCYFSRVPVSFTNSPLPHDVFGVQGKPQGEELLHHPRLIAHNFKQVAYSNIPAKLAAYQTGVRSAQHTITRCLPSWPPRAAFPSLPSLTLDTQPGLPGASRPETSRPPKERPILLVLCDLLQATATAARVRHVLPRCWRVLLTTVSPLRCLRLWRIRGASTDPIIVTVVFVVITVIPRAAPTPLRHPTPTISFCPHT